MTFDVLLWTMSYISKREKSHEQPRTNPASHTCHNCINRVEVSHIYVSSPQREVIRDITGFLLVSNTIIGICTLFANNL